MYRKVVGEILRPFAVIRNAWQNLCLCVWYDAWGNNVVSDTIGAIITDKNHIGNLNPFRYRGY